MIKRLGGSMPAGPVLTNVFVSKKQNNLEIKNQYLEKLLGSFDGVEGDPPTLQISYLLVSQLVSGKQQPRLYFEEESLENLAESIRSADGIIEPLIVRPLGQNYEIIAGERRWRAAKILDMMEVPCIVRELTDKKSLIISLIENLQRENLNAMESADALAIMINEYGMSHREAANAVGKSRSAVSNLIRLRDLSSIVQAALRNRLIEMGHARALITLNHKLQDEWLEKIVENKYSVRKVEALIKQGQSDLESKSTVMWYSKENKSRIDSLSDFLALNVTLNSKSKKLSFSFRDNHELDELLQILEKGIGS